MICGPGARWHKLAGNFGVQASFRQASRKSCDNRTLRPRFNLMTFRFKICVLVWLASPLAATSAAAAPGDADCIEDWSVAAGIVAAEKLRRVEELSPLVGQALNGAIVRTQLCREGDKYVYRIVVRDRRGQLSKHKVDARKPAAIRPADAP